MLRKFFRCFSLLLFVWAMGFVLFITYGIRDPVSNTGLHNDVNLEKHRRAVFTVKERQLDDFTAAQVLLKGLGKRYTKMTIKSAFPDTHLSNNSKGSSYKIKYGRGSRLGYRDEMARELRHKKYEDAKKYFTMRSNKMNPLNTNFIISNIYFCDNKIPYILILIPSLHRHYTVRDAIRRTYGSLSNSKLADVNLTSDVDVVFKVLFLFGRGDTPEMDIKIRNESKEYGDIVQADFKESYKNLTMKILMGLAWTSTFCAEAEYVLKVDEDVFMNLPVLIRQLREHPFDRKGAIYGHINVESTVRRGGKWAVSRDIYPLMYYPTYASGNSYVISGNIVPRLVMVSEYMPYIPIEDAYITGCLARVIGANHTTIDGFTFWLEKSPNPCEFFRTNRISANRVSVSLMFSLWKTYLTFNETCTEPTTNTIVNVTAKQLNVTSLQ